MREGFGTHRSIRFGVRAAPGPSSRACEPSWAPGCSGSPAAWRRWAIQPSSMLARKFLEAELPRHGDPLPDAGRRPAEMTERLRSGVRRLDALLGGRHAARRGGRGGAAPAIMAMFGAGFGPRRMRWRGAALLPATQTLWAIQTHALYAVDRPLATTRRPRVRLGSRRRRRRGRQLVGITGAAIGSSPGRSSTGIKLVCCACISGARAQALDASADRGHRVAYAAGFAVSHLCIRFMPEPWDILAAVSAGTVVYALHSWLRAGSAAATSIGCAVEPSGCVAVRQPGAPRWPDTLVTTRTTGDPKKWRVRHDRTAPATSRSRSTRAGGPGATGSRGTPGVDRQRPDRNRRGGRPASGTGGLARTDLPRSRARRGREPQPSYTAKTRMRVSRSTLGPQERCPACPLASQSPGLDVCAERRRR